MLRNRLDRDDRQMALPFGGPVGAAPPDGPADEPLRSAAGPSSSGGFVTPDPPGPAPVLRLVHNPRARRYIIRVGPDGTIRVTIPRRGTAAEAHGFVHEHRAWIDDQLARLRRMAPASTRALVAGDLVWLRGVPTPVTTGLARPGLVRVGLGDTLACVVAPAADLRPVVSAMLRALARRDLPPRLHALAARHDLTVTRVTIRNQRGRWGSCAPGGSISLNWRLVQMPPEVCDYVLLHELMHLREANHSRRFWRHVVRACPWHLDARRWLRQEGKALL